MKLIAIIGKSGSGKTFVAKKLAKRLNAALISLDNISHQVLKLNKYKTFVKQIAGAGVFKFGSIDRKKLGKQIFADENKRRKINQEAERLMIDILDRKLKTIKSEFVILDYALLPLMKYYDECCFKIYVTASDSVRLSRATKRDKISKEYFETRDKPLDFYDNINFDIEIKNNYDNENELDSQIEDIAKTIKLKETKNA